MVQKKTNGLVLSGGGARGAYEAGVMLYIRDHMPRRMGKHINFDVITGTSVGALNGAYIAATMADLDNQAKGLVAAWAGQRLEQLISLKPADLFRAGRLLLGKDPPPPDAGTFRYGGILDTAGLEKFVFNVVPWRGIRKNIRSGNINALAIAATHVGTGHNVIFIDKKEPLPTWSRNPFVRAIPTAIGPRHTLASAAIPVLFPSVKIGKGFYVDGGLRNNTPMSPAIRLGANRLLIISLKHKATKADEDKKAAQHEADYPKPLFLMAKALNALMLDPTSYDLERMQRINQILDAGEKAYGNGFAEVLSDFDREGATLQRIEAVHIQPSEDIGAIASRFLESGGPQLSSRVTRKLLERFVSREGKGEADLLSYILFEGKYGEELIELGYQDAKSQSDELLEVFG